MVVLALVQMAACRMDTVALQHDLVDAESIRKFHSARTSGLRLDGGLVQTDAGA